MTRVAIKRVAGAEDLPLPTKSSAGAAGYDLRANIAKPIVLDPGKRRFIPCGIVLELPDGFEAQVRGRSGLSLNHGIVLIAGVGTIDSDYRGEIAAVLVNHGEESFVVNRGDRVAQMVIARVEAVELEVVKELSPTKRGDRGFGSTGR